MKDDSNVLDFLVGEGLVYLMVAGFAAGTAFVVVRWVLS